MIDDGVVPFVTILVPKKNAVIGMSGRRVRLFQEVGQLRRLTERGFHEEDMIDVGAIRIGGGGFLGLSGRRCALCLQTRDRPQAEESEDHDTTE